MTKTTTITEALAELKVLAKRIETKQSFVGNHLTRQEALKDPLSKDGGSELIINREMQAIGDLREQAVTIRRAIADANAQTTVSVNGSTRSIADWLRWRRDIMPGERQFVAMLVATVERARQEAGRRGSSLVSAQANVGDSKPNDIIVNLSEVELNKRREELEALVESLDGQLSLKNATVTISY